MAGSPLQLWLRLALRPCPGQVPGSRAELCRQGAVGRAEEPGQGRAPAGGSAIQAAEGRRAGPSLTQRQRRGRPQAAHPATAPASPLPPLAAARRIWPRVRLAPAGGRQLRAATAGRRVLREAPEHATPEGGGERSPRGGGEGGPRPPRPGCQACVAAGTGGRGAEPRPVSRDSRVLGVLSGERRRPSASRSLLPRAAVHVRFLSLCAGR